MTSLVPPISLKKVTTHDSIWTRMQSIVDTKRVPQALLFVGPPHANILAFVYRFVAAIFCNDADRPCGVCQSCSMIQQNIHPDLEEITPESRTSSIKIEQIRDLQQNVYQTPQCATHRFILMHPIDQLNRAAANALLKILEEPPKHVVFILVAEQNTIVDTILSRCQQVIFPPPECTMPTQALNYLEIAHYYPNTSPRHQLYQKRGQLITLLIELLEEKIDVCTAATPWQEYPLEDVLWFFYLLTSTLITTILTGSKHSMLENQHTLIKCMLSRYKQPMHLYSQLDLISEFIAKVQQNVPLNQTLVIETLLLSYLEASYVYTH